MCLGPGGTRLRQATPHPACLPHGHPTPRQHPTPVVRGFDPNCDPLTRSTDALPVRVSVCRGRETSGKPEPPVFINKRRGPVRPHLSLRQRVPVPSHESHNLCYGSRAALFPRVECCPRPTSLPPGSRLPRPPRGGARAAVPSPLLTPHRDQEPWHIPPPPYRLLWEYIRCPFIKFLMMLASFGPRQGDCFQLLCNHRADSNSGFAHTQVVEFPPLLGFCAERRFCT